MTEWTLAAVLVALAIAWRHRPRAALRRPATREDHRGADTRMLRRRMRSGPAGVAAVCAVGVIVPELAVVAVTAWVGTRLLRPPLSARRRLRRIDDDLPDAIDLIVLTVRAGLPPAEALREVAAVITPPLRDGFADVVHRLDRGEPFDDAIRALPDTIGPAADGLVDVIGTTTRYGLALEPVLDQLTGEARAARQRRQQADARRLPVRLSFPLVACTLPSFVLLAIAPAVIAALSSLGSSAW